MRITIHRLSSSPGRQPLVESKDNFVAAVLGLVGNLQPGQEYFKMGDEVAPVENPDLQRLFDETDEVPLFSAERAKADTAFTKTYDFRVVAPQRGSDEIALNRGVGRIITHQASVSRHTTNGVQFSLQDLEHVHGYLSEAGPVSYRLLSVHLATRALQNITEVLRGIPR